MTQLKRNTNLKVEGVESVLISPSHHDALQNLTCLLYILYHDCDPAPERIKWHRSTVSKAFKKSIKPHLDEK